MFQYIKYRTSKNEGGYWKKHWKWWLQGNDRRETNDTLRKFKSAAKTCKVSTVGSKMDIIMRIKAAALKDGKKYCKIFSKIWGHSGGWLSFSCPHGVVYYLKFLLRFESSLDYVDGLLSMEHWPNITFIDMAHIVANHALVYRKEDVIKYGYDENGFF